NVFEQLDLTGASVTTTIKDAASPTDPEVPGEEDTVTVTLTGPGSVTEGETTGSYTVTLSEPAPAGSIVTLSYSYTTASGEDIIETVQAVIGADGKTATFTITTKADQPFEGPESFTVSVSGITVGGNNVFEKLDLSGASVETTITDTNNPPTTTDLQASGNEDADSIAIPTLSGADIDGSVVSFTINSLPTNGTLMFNGVAVTVGQSILIANAADLTFVPNANWNGETSFTYSAVDNVGAVDQSPATVAIVVASVNDAPVAVNDVNSVDEDASVTATALTGVLENDSDIDGGTLTVTEIRTGTEAGTGNSGIVGSALTGTYGTLTLNANGSYTYIADQAAANALAEGQQVTETFTYTVSDGQGGFDTAELTITITGTNDSPVITNDSVTSGAVVEAGDLDNGTDVAGTPSATGQLNATDVDADATESWSVLDATNAYGTFSVDGTGKWTFTLDNNAAA
ncbi:VCBS domain-containing protein, partial [Shewanella sp. JM162201]